MARSNLFANIENQFEFSNESEITLKTQQAFYTFATKLAGTLDETRTVMLLITAARLGVSSKNGKLNKKEKTLAVVTFGELLNAISQAENMIAGKVTEEDYKIVEIISQMSNDIAFDFLYLVLGFAYIDNEIDDKVMERLDEMLSMNLLSLFMQSDLEEVPKPRIKLSGLEEDIVKCFKTKDKLISLNEIAAKFPNKSKTEIKRVLDGLCDKGILFGGDKIAGCRYALV